MTSPNSEPDRAPFHDPVLDIEPMRAAWVRALAARLVRDGHAADDLAQDAWVAASRAAPLDEPSFRNWIAAVLSRLVAKRARGDASRAARERSVARREGLESADEVVDRAETHRALVQSVLALEEPYRSTPLLRYFDELSPSQIAERQSVPIRTVKTRLTRGLERLRERLDREHRGDRSQWMAALLPLTHTTTLGPVAIGAVLLKSKFAYAACAAIALACIAFVVTRTPDADHHSATLADHSGSADSILPAPLTVSSLGPAARAEIGTSAEARQHTATIDPERNLHGTVTDSRGVPVLAARVTAFRAAKSALPRTQNPPEGNVEPLAETWSDALGEFHIDIEQGSALDLCVEHPGYARFDAAMRHAGESVAVVLSRVARIHGHVSLEGVAVADAIVRAGTPHVDRSWRRVETDANGEYAIEGLGAGDFEMRIESQGAVTGRTSPFAVDEGETVERDFVLDRGLLARGTVTDARTGLPIEGAIVDTSDRDERNQARTNASGAYELRGIDEWFSIHLTARAEGFAVGVQALVPGPGMRADFVLDRGLSARGRVLDSKGTPIAGVEVSAIGALDSQLALDIRATRTLLDGTFVLTVLHREAAHDLRLLKSGFGGKAYAFPEDEGRRELVDFGDLRLSEAGVITGRAVDVEGQPLVDWWVRIYGGNSDHLHFTEGRRDIAPRANLHSTRTDDRGRFTIGDLTEGPYLVNVSIKGYTAFANREVRLKEGELLDAGDLAIDVGLTIEGVVMDQQERPIASATVEAYAELDDTGRLTYALTDTRGRFTIRGLAAGQHSLRLDFGLTPSSVRDLHASSWLRNVSAGSRNVVLVPPRAAALRVLVLGRDGEPAAGVTVSASAMDEDPDGWPADAGQTDADGRFEFRLEKGVLYRIRALEMPARIELGTRALSAAKAENVAASTEELVLRLVEVR